MVTMIPNGVLRHPYCEKKGRRPRDVHQVDSSTDNEHAADPKDHEAKDESRDKESDGPTHENECPCSHTRIVVACAFAPQVTVVRRIWEVGCR